MANPSIPPFATFPVPPPAPRFKIIDKDGHPTPHFFHWCQLMWAALQGKGGIIDDAELALLIFGNEAATAESVLGQHPSITEMPGSDISDLSVRMDRVEQIAILAYASAPSAGSGSGGSSSTGSWIPLTDGSEPPNFITDGAGSLILVWYDP